MHRAQDTHIEDDGTRAKTVKHTECRANVGGRCGKSKVHSFVSDAMVKKIDHCLHLHCHSRFLFHFGAIMMSLSCFDRRSLQTHFSGEQGANVFLVNLAS